MRVLSTPSSPNRSKESPKTSPKANPKAKVVLPSNSRRSPRTKKPVRRVMSNPMKLVGYVYSKFFVLFFTFSLSMFRFY